MDGVLDINSNKEEIYAFLKANKTGITLTEKNDKGKSARKSLKRIREQLEEKGLFVGVKGKTKREKKKDEILCYVYK